MKVTASTANPSKAGRWCHGWCGGSLGRAVSEETRPRRSSSARLARVASEMANRLTLIQEHAMIMRAIGNGITPEQIAKALDIDTTKIKANLTLPKGIHQDAVEILKNKPITMSRWHWVSCLYAMTTQGHKVLSIGHRPYGRDQHF